MAGVASGSARADSSAASLPQSLPESPFAALPPGTVLRRSPKRLLVELSRQLEREAMRIGESCVGAASFQEAAHCTDSTRRRYRQLVDRTGFVCALGEDLPAEPLPGLRGPPSTRTTRGAASGTSWCSGRTSAQRCWRVTSVTPDPTPSGVRVRPDLPPRDRRRHRGKSAVPGGAEAVTDPARTKQRDALTGFPRDAPAQAPVNARRVWFGYSQPVSSWLRPTGFPSTVRWWVAQGCCPGRFGSRRCGH